MSSRNLFYSRESILKGSKLHARDRGRAELLEAGLLGMYAFFTGERREVADAFKCISASPQGGTDRRRFSPRYDRDDGLPQG
jgi:hypothetical protein